MSSFELQDHLAEPIRHIGEAFYFSPQAVAVGDAIELDVVTFYAAGRGGVLGDIEAAEVDEIFYFFKDGMVAAMMDKARSRSEREVAIAHHMDAAASFAAATFGGIESDTLVSFSDAAAALAATLPSGRWPIVDGYLALDVPEDIVATAYYWCIVLRELRGGVHTDAIKAAGLSGAAAVQSDRDGMMFGLHGYSDEDRVEVTDELVAARAQADHQTAATMAELLSVMDPAQDAALRAGATAMYEALAAPVAVG